MMMNVQNVKNIVCIRLAEKNILIHSSSELPMSFFNNYLNAFDTSDIEISIDEHDLIQIHSKDEYESSLLERHSTNNVAIVYNWKSQISLCVLKKLATAMIGFDTILMHGVVIGYNQNSIMITAPSGIGKTTRAKIWLDEYPQSYIVNGDKPFLRIAEKGIFAYGSPWCGKEEWNTNTVVPLKAILLLQRADDGEENTITEVNLSTSFPFLLQQVYRPFDQEHMRKTIQLLKSMEGKVKFYIFRSNPTPEAIRLAYETVFSK